MPRDRADVVATLCQKGFTLRQGNRDHDFLFLQCDGMTQAVFTKVSRGTGHRTIGDPLLGRMARQLRLSKGGLLDLVDCPMTGTQYLDHLKRLGILY